MPLGDQLTAEDRLLRDAMRAEARRMRPLTMGELDRLESGIAEQNAEAMRILHGMSPIMSPAVRPWIQQEARRLAADPTLPRPDTAAWSTDLPPAMQERLRELSRMVAAAGLTTPTEAPPVPVTRPEPPPATSDTRPDEPGVYWAYLTFDRPRWGWQVVRLDRRELYRESSGDYDWWYIVTLGSQMENGVGTVRRWGPRIEPFRLLDNETAEATDAT